MEDGRNLNLLTKSFGRVVWFNTSFSQQWTIFPVISMTINRGRRYTLQKPHTLWKSLFTPVLGCLLLNSDFTVAFKALQKILMIPCKILGSLPCPVVIIPVIIDGNSAAVSACCVSYTPCTARGSCQLSCPVVLNTFLRLLYGTNPRLSLAAEFQILKNETGQWLFPYERH